MASLDDAHLALRTTTDDRKEKVHSQSMINSQDWQLGKSLNASLLYLYENQLFTDISFRCRDHVANDRIKAHKVILAARSPVFQAMFYGPCAEQKEEIELPVIDANIFHVVLKYLYSDTTDLTELDASDASDVLMIADMYQISELTEFCAKYLASVIMVNNACDILEIALLLQIDSLIEAACDFIDDNADLIIGSENFMQTSASCQDYILNGYFAEMSTVKKEISKCERKKSKVKYMWHKLKNKFTSEHAQTKYRVPQTQTVQHAQTKYKRVPQTQTVSLPFECNAFLCNFTSNLECSILILVLKDCLIKNVKFHKLEVFEDFMTRRQRIRNALISGSLMIDNMFVMTLMFNNDEEGTTFSLSKRVKLSKRDKPYTMKIKLEFIPFTICATVNRNKRSNCKQNSSECEHAATCIHSLNDNGKNEHVKTSYCTNCEYINIVDFFSVTFLSNRNQPEM